MKSITQYFNTSDLSDVVTIDTILKRYIDIHGTIDGFEEYVKSGFKNGNEVEYRRRNIDKVIGFVYCFEPGDYQISLMSLTDKDNNTVQQIIMKYDDECSAFRGDEKTTLEDANVDYWMEVTK